MWLPDNVIAHLRAVAAEPDLTGTHYELRGSIAQGGMGSVWRVFDRRLEREVALKVLHIDDPDGEVAARMEREARVLARLEHPNVVPVYDAGHLADGRPYYCMRLVEGQTLTNYATGAHPLQQRLSVFQRVCDAVAFGHSRGVIHRDLKPDNIMLGAFGEVFVMDWGVAKVAGAWHTQPGTVAGTPDFVAPEQLAGDFAGAGARADVFALGRILEFLIGNGPKRLRAVAAKACATLPADRYGSAIDLRTEIERYMEGLPVEAYREPPHERLWRFAANNRTLLLLLAAYVMVRALIYFFRRI